MKNYLLPEARITASYSKKGQRSYLIISLISIALYLSGAFAFFYALYMICNMIGSIVSGTASEAIHELIRVLPILIAELGLIYVAAFVHNALMPKSKIKFHKSIKKNGIICITIGTIIILYVIIGLCTKLYHSFVEGYPTRLFPLNLCFFGLAYLAIGVLLLVFNDKIELDLPYEDHKSHVAFGIFGTIYYMAALFACSAFIFSFFIVDWSHGHIFYSLMLELMLIIVIAMLAIYNFVYLPLVKEKKNEFAFRASLTFLIINVIVFILYIVSFSADLSAPSDAWYGILCVDFTASFNAITYIYGLVLIVTPLVALIKSLLKKAKKQLNHC